MAERLDEDTIHKYNTSTSSPTSYVCYEKFPEAWVRNGHEAMYAYVGRRKDENRWTNDKYVEDASHPKKINMVNHFWQNNARYWCFVAGRKRITHIPTDYAEWWLHLKKISGQGC